MRYKQYRKYSEEEFLLKEKYYESLPEKQRRHFLALEYKSLGRGSQRYLAEMFGCCRKTIRKGCEELNNSEVEPIDYSRQRKAGGGRKKKKTP